MTYPGDDGNPKKWAFGDRIENDAASPDNPTRFGFFIRRKVRSGVVNPGAYVELTDGRGGFWKSNAEPGRHSLRRIELTAIISIRS